MKALLKSGAFTLLNRLIFAVRKFRVTGSRTLFSIVVSLTCTATTTQQ